jgi:hypothetical protein
MIFEIPQYGLRAYALFFLRHGTKEEFSQSELDWIVGQSMKKKIFSLLLRAGWIKKESRSTYKCINPEEALKGLMQFKVPEIIREAQRQYAFTNLSAVEIWSDYSYVQRGMEKSPYFIKVLKKDMRYWKQFFSKKNIPCYINSGSTIGEYVILLPANKIDYEEKDGFKVESLNMTLSIAKENEMYDYAYEYMRDKYAGAKGKRNI